MEDLTSTPAEESDLSKQMQQNTSTSQQTAANVCGIFTCSFCYLKERYDYKVLGADCSMCKRIVCLGCSIFYTQRFCLKCASNNMQKLPFQLHGKINNLMKHYVDSSK
ncbi:unnamed protein product [Lasius platythorax]|uniref:Cysteine-rich DPF motif domain-containing protein 1 n=1 Tax=Lasius platythorax TaxID=488582 RepID=A0AAV2N6H6_9HYME